MTDVDQQLQQLRDSYLRDLAPRFDALDERLTALIEAGFPPDAFQEFLRLIHNLSGSSGLFGLAELHTAAREVEACVARYVEAGTGPQAQEIEGLRRGLAALRQAIQGRSKG